MPDMPMLIKLSKELDVSVDYLLGVQRSDEIMEQVNKHTVSGRRANSLKGYQQNCIANSNALHSTSGTFAELSVNAKRLLGLSTKKALYCQRQQRAKTKKF